VLTCLRRATGKLHRRIEERFDAVSELADPSRRPLIIGRYAAFYSSAHALLAAMLEGVEGLDFARRTRAWTSTGLFASAAETVSAFPKPADQCEALGHLYVVEGSTLGGRLILRELRARGIADPALSFLDPYGSASGSIWRSLIAIIEREGSRGPIHLEGLCRGAMRGFTQAETILCGDVR
jgi:heme oxygenase